MKAKKIFWGVLFIIAAVLLVVNNTIDFNNMNEGIFKDVLGYIAFDFINIIVLILMLIIVYESAKKRIFFGIFFPLVLIARLYAVPLGIEDVSIWILIVAAFLLSIGFTIIFSKNVKGILIHSKSEKFDQIIDEEDDSSVKMHVTFGSSVKYINSKDFKNGSFDCSFGALKVYFDNAKLNKDGANIRINCTFGAMELYIPKEWKIVNNTNCSLSGIEEKNPNKPEDGYTVTLTGDISFSGIEIIYI